MKKYVDIRTTAYHAKERDHVKYKNFSAVGTILKKGRSIAADWSVFPVGTQLKIHEQIYEVSDYGSALVKPENSIPTVDMFVANRSEMNKWGVKYFNNVEVVKWGCFERSATILKQRLQYAHCKTMYNRILTNHKIL